MLVLVSYLMINIMLLLKEGNFIKILTLKKRYIP